MVSCNRYANVSRYPLAAAANVVVQEIHDGLYLASSMHSRLNCTSCGNDLHQGVASYSFCRVSNEQTSKGLLHQSCAYSTGETNYFLDNYYTPWCRCQPYLVGVVLGYILHTTKGQPIKLSKVNSKLIMLFTFVDVLSHSSVPCTMVLATCIWHWNWSCLRLGRAGLSAHRNSKINGGQYCLREPPQAGMGTGIGLDGICMCQRLWRLVTIFLYDH